MPTTIHLPPKLLESVDKRAADLGLSRNRYIILALERAIEEQTSWSPRFLEELNSAADDVGGQELIDRMVEDIKSHRTRKTHPDL